MAHTSFYRTYRPATFADMVGQKHIERTLRNAVAADQVAHAYLFSGPRGTGKTTTARILAAALLCEHPKAGEPDGSCEQCQEVANGTHPDVMELDAASRTGVDNVRDEIIARVQFAPVRGRSKIYIIDEVHMLSTGAFNAFLKTLEEPPDHVVFILCTTDPQKVPETIRSRCQQFEFRPYAVEELTDQLGRIGAAEGIKAEPEALALIASRARGGMRDAITAYEQLAAFTDNNITVAAVEATLGGADAASLAALVRIVATADTPACFTWVADQVNRGADLPEVVGALIDYVRDLYVLQVLGACPGVIDRSEAEQARMGELLTQLAGPEQIARMLDLLAELSAALRWANEPRTLLELALVRMTRPESDLSLAALSQRLEALEQGRVAAPAVDGSDKQPPASTGQSVRSGNDSADTGQSVRSGNDSAGTGQSARLGNDSADTGQSVQSGNDSTGTGQSVQFGNDSVGRDDPARHRPEQQPPVGTGQSIQSGNDSTGTGQSDRSGNDPVGCEAPGKQSSGLFSAEQGPAPRDDPARHRPEPQRDAAPADTPPAADPLVAPPAPATDAARLWREVLAQIRKTAPSRYAVFAEAELESDPQGGYLLNYPPTASFQLSQAKTTDYVALMNTAAEAVCGQALNPRFVLRDEPHLPDMPGPEVTVNDLPDDPANNRDFDPPADYDSSYTLDTGQDGQSGSDPTGTGQGNRPGSDLVGGDALSAERPEDEPVASFSAEQSASPAPPVATSQDNAAPASDPSATPANPATPAPAPSAPASAPLPAPSLQASPASAATAAGAASPPKDVSAIFADLGALPIASATAGADSDARDDAGEKQSAHPSFDVLLEDESADSNPDPDASYPDDPGAPGNSAIPE
ncbi:MAG: DNA polymerase III subunit gamma/tau [Coriobacteriia bacterium]|nr:DNA polymerase III subunit gamma/tau [Coriobacteriia bacterium]